MSAVPESGETVSLSMAGFPGRWLQILLLSHQLYSKHVSCWAGPGEHGVRCLSAPPEPRRRGQRPQALGRGEACLALPLEIWGPAAMTFRFSSQVPAFRKRGSHQAPLARPLASSHSVHAPTWPWDRRPRQFPGSPRPRAEGTALTCSVSAAGASHPQCTTCSQHLPTSPTQDCLSPRLCHPRVP